MTTFVFKIMTISSNTYIFYHFYVFSKTSFVNGKHIVLIINKMLFISFEFYHLPAAAHLFAFELIHKFI